MEAAEAAVEEAEEAEEAEAVEAGIATRSPSSTTPPIRQAEAETPLEEAAVEGAAVEEEGSRPPGLLVAGEACRVLWSGTQRWVVEEGFSGLEGLDGLGGDVARLGKDLFAVASDDARSD